MSFSLDLKAFAEKAADRADEAVGRIVIGVAGELDERSPVGDAVYWKSPPPKGYVGGHFRANWQLGVNSLPIGERAGVDPTGANTRAAIRAEVPDEAAGNVYWLANNVPYARRIEDGWSRQAPQGLVGLTAIMFQKIVKDEIAEMGK